MMMSEQTGGAAYELRFNIRSRRRAVSDAGRGSIGERIGQLTERRLQGLLTGV